jgi:CHAT domain-containing protein
MGLLALNLKGLLLDREFRLQAALARSSDPSVAEWRRKLWDLQVQSLSVRPEPVDPSTEGFHPKEVVRNSPFTIAEEKKLETAQREIRVQAAALPGAERRKIVSPEDVSDSLPENSALIEFMRYGRNFGGLNQIEQRFGAVVLVKGKPAQWVSLKAAANLSSLVKDYVALMRRSEDEPPSPAEAEKVFEGLGSAVWKPIEDVLPQGCKTVFISPDSDLHLVSFATLRTDGHFVCENHDFIYLTSGRSLPKPFTFGTAKRSVDIWGDPDFDAMRSAGLGKSEVAAMPARRGFGFRFERLQGTEKEAQGVKAIAEGQGLPVHLHLKEHASEAALRKVESPLILHLCTHGFFFPIDKPGADKPWQVGGLANQFNGDAPLYQSGIALAGANKAINAWQQSELAAPFDDGIFVAAEATQLKLQDTWLVMISACDSGLGGVANGEGLLGLKLGFLQAGAQNVCFSLWRVTDAYAPKFVSQFYEKALRSGNPSTALAELQRNELVNLSGESGGGFPWKAAKRAGPFIVTARAF